MTLTLAHEKKYLLAVSGGVDSMVMCDLFLQAKVVFGVAHCNFQLRPKDADNDEAFVQAWCQQNHIDFFVQKFDTAAYAETQRVSVQVAARDLRYAFFNELLVNEHYDFLVTAHHRDDNIETLLFHFFRGTGLQGLQGIPAVNRQVIRPLLPYPKSEIMHYAINNKIAYREDSSNAKTDYTRNKLRNLIIPQLEEIFPQFTHNMTANMARFTETHIVYHQQIENYRKKLIESRGKDFYIPTRKLKNVVPLSIILFELLKPFGFGYDQSQQVLHLLHSASGRKLQNERYTVLKDRDFLIITPVDTTQSDCILIEENTHKIDTGEFELRINHLSHDKTHLQKKSDVLQADATDLRYPMILRRWRTGDYMMPLGMKKKKKIARILIDEKIPLHEKENIWVLESEKRIVWLLGLKTDERFKLTPQTKNILQIQLIKK